MSILLVTGEIGMPLVATLQRIEIRGARWVPLPDLGLHPPGKAEKLLLILDKLPSDLFLWFSQDGPLYIYKEKLLAFHERGQLYVVIVLHKAGTLVQRGVESLINEHFLHVPWAVLDSTASVVTLVTDLSTRLTSPSFLQKDKESFFKTYPSSMGNAAWEWSKGLALSQSALICQRCREVRGEYQCNNCSAILCFDCKIATHTLFFKSHIVKLLIEREDIAGYLIIRGKIRRNNLSPGTSPASQYQAHHRSLFVVTQQGKWEGCKCTTGNQLTAYYWRCRICEINLCSFCTELRDDDEPLGSRLKLSSQLPENNKDEHRKLGCSNAGLFARFFGVGTCPDWPREFLGLTSEAFRDFLTEKSQLPQGFVKSLPYALDAALLALEAFDYKKLNVPLLCQIIECAPSNHQVVLRAEALAQKIYMDLRGEEKVGTCFKEYMDKSIIGQPHVKSRIESLVNLLTSSPGEPQAHVLVLAGPSGTGKTLLAKLLSHGVDKTGDSLFQRYDMSSYASREHANSFTGSAVGFEGSSAGGQLVTDLLDLKKRWVAHHSVNFPVVLFDEFDRAHPCVLDVLLSLFAEGVIRDASGPRRKVECQGMVFICTTNAGLSHIQKNRDSLRGAARSESPMSHPAMQEAVDAVCKDLKAAKADIRGPLSDALVSRLQYCICVFLPFDDKEKKELIDSHLKQLALSMWKGSHASSPGTCLTWEPTVRDHVCQQLPANDAGHQLGQLLRKFEEELAMHLSKNNVRRSATTKLPRLFISAYLWKKKLAFMHFRLPDLIQSPAEGRLNPRPFRWAVSTTLGKDVYKRVVFEAANMAEVRSALELFSRTTIVVYDSKLSHWIMPREDDPSAAFDELPEECVVRLI